MKGKIRWYSILLIGLVLLLTSSVIGCGESYMQEDLDAAYETGHAEGYDDGSHAGYKVGYDEGYDTGYETGSLEGYEVGYTEGKDAGLAETDEAKAHFEQGNIYLKQGAWDKAITEFDEVINLSPELEAAALFGRGTAYAWTGDYVQAEHDFNKAYDMGPGSASRVSIDTDLAWGIALTGRYNDYSRLSQAGYLFDSAISTDPDNPDAYTGRALTRLKEAFGDIIEEGSIGFGNLRQAISDFEKAIELDPEGIQGRIKRFNFEGDMAFLPNYIEANRRCGAVLLSTDTYISKGLEEYDSVLKVYPDDVEALIGRGSAYMRLGQYNEAILDFNVAIKLAPNNAHAYAGRGIAYSKQDNHNAASKDFEKTIKLDNRYEKGLYYLAYVTSYYDDANPISYVKAFLRTYRSLGDEYSKNKMYDLAIQSYTMTTKLDYDHWRSSIDDRTLAFWGRAKAYSQTGVYDKAIADFEEAARDSENEICYALGAKYFIPLAVVYWKVGNYGAASAAFSEADSFMNFEDFMDAESYLAMGVVRYHAEDKWGFKIWGYNAVENALRNAIESAPGSSLAAEAQQYLNKLQQNRDAFP